MKHSQSIAVLLTTLALAFAGSSAFARPHRDEGRDKDRDRRERVERPRGRISLDQAVSMAERRFYARVVRAESRGDGERVVYVLRLLNEAGRVWTVTVDANSGSMH
jgi:uncharacterized membrane protein YkoI